MIKAISIALTVALVFSLYLVDTRIADASIIVRDNSSFTGTGSGTANHMNNVTNGDALLVGCAVNNSGTNRIATVTDTKGNTYVRAGSYGGTNIEIELWYALNATVDNGTQLTVFTTVGTDQFACTWFDVQGLATTNAFDRTAGASGTGTALDSGNTAVTQQANEIVIGVNGQANNRAWGSGSGFTQIGSTGSGTAAGDMVQYKVVSSAGVQDSQATLDISSNWVTGIFTFADTAISPGNGARAITSDVVLFN